jgi:hypothetical protein
MEQDIYPLNRIVEGAHLIPSHMIGAVKRYILQGIPPGSFLTAVLCNDLRAAFAQADDDNAAAMQGWVRFFYNYAPSGCWGSTENYHNWLAKFRKEAV